MASNQTPSGASPSSPPVGAPESTPPSTPATEPASAPEPLWALVWSEAQGVRTVSTFEDVRAAYAEPANRLWVDLNDPGRELLVGLGEVFSLHPLVTEDILE